MIPVLGRGVAAGILFALLPLSAQAAVLERSTLKGDAPTALLQCGPKVFGLTRCQGQPLDVGAVDLSPDPELVGEEVVADVTVTATFVDTLNTIRLHVGDKTAYFGAGPVVLTPSLTLRAGETVAVRFTTDIDTAPYSLPGSPQASVSAVRVSLRPSVPTQLAWRRTVERSAATLRGYLSLYQAVKLLPELVGKGDAELEALERKAEQEATAVLTASGTNLTWAELLYPDDHPEERKRGTLKAFRDMPPAWSTALRAKPELPRLLSLFASIRAVRKGLRVMSPEEASATVATARGLLDEAVADGYAWQTLLAKWRAVAAAELREVEAALATLLAEAETDSQTHPTPGG